jgi:t-SNARE complex subunit (syntaxin)
MQEEINQASGRAKAILLEAEARQKALNAISKALTEVSNITMLYVLYLITISRKHR